MKSSAKRNASSHSPRRAFDCNELRLDESFLVPRSEASCDAFAFYERLETPRVSSVGGHLGEIVVCALRRGEGVVLLGDPKALLNVGHAFGVVRKPVPTGRRFSPMTFVLSGIAPMMRTPDCSKLRFSGT